MRLLKVLCDPRFDWMKHLTVDGTRHGKLTNCWKVTLNSCCGLGIGMLATGILADSGIGMACIVGSITAQVVLMVGGTWIFAFASGILVESYCRQKRKQN